jgi:hypothetical protein
LKLGRRDDVPVFFILKTLTTTFAGSNQGKRKEEKRKKSGKPKI